MKKLTDQVVADGYIPFVWGDMFLNKEMIIKSGILPLEEIERICFQ